MLDKDDIQVIKEIVATVRRQPIGADSLPPPGEDFPAPDVYVVFLSQEIPPMAGPVQAETGTGSTPHGDELASGTGTGYVIGSYVVYTANADVYQVIVKGDDDSADLELIGLQLPVYNVSLSAASGWCVAKRDKGGRWLVEGTGSSSSGEIFEAYLTDRDGTDYAWKDADGNQVGTLKAKAVKVKTQEADGLNPVMYTVTIDWATGGTYTIVEDGGSPITANFDDVATDLTLSVFTVINGSPSPGVLVFIGPDGSDHTLDIDGTDLLPVNPHSPAVFRNDTEESVDVGVYLKYKDGDNVAVTINDLDTGVFRVRVSHFHDGLLGFRFDNTGDFVTVSPNFSAADLQTALTTQLACTVDENLIVTVTADSGSHTLTSDLSRAFGDVRYGVIWSNGNQCTGPIGGCDPNGVPGYVGISTPGATVVQTNIGDSGSNRDTFHLTISEAGGGTYKLVVDSGSPLTTTYPSPPTTPPLPNMPGGWAVTLYSSTATVFTYKLVAPDTSPGHTVVVYPSSLRGRSVKNYLVVEDGCAEFVQGAKCDPDVVGT